MLILLALACATETTVDLAAAVDGYDGWDQPAGWAGVVPSCDGTHGPFVQIWYNDIASADAAAGATAWSDGATLVKAVYDAVDGSPTKLAAMTKAAGFDDKGGDWYWGDLAADGTINDEGAMSGCSGCHAGASTDYVLYPDSTAVTDAADCP